MSFYTKYLLLFFAVVLLCTSSVLAASAGYSDPHTAYTTVTDGSISIVVPDDEVFVTAYYSVGGEEWEAISLSNSQSPWVSNWGSLSLPLSLFSTTEENYFVVYSCSRSFISSIQGWDCHGNNWQLIPFTVSNI